MSINKEWNNECIIITAAQMHNPISETFGFMSSVYLTLFEKCVRKQRKRATFTQTNWFEYLKYIYKFDL